MPWLTVDLLRSGLYYVLVFALTLILSGATYRWVEQPAIALGRRLNHGWRTTPAMEVAP